MAKYLDPSVGSFIPVATGQIVSIPFADIDAFNQMCNNAVIAAAIQQNVLTAIRCADCGGEIGKDTGPLDGWQLEDGRTVCQACNAQRERLETNGSGVQS